MATKTFEELKQLAIQIRDEKTNKQNTATRVGTAMLEHINKLEQDYYDKIQTDEELKERDEKLTELTNKQSIYNVDTNVPLESGFYTSTTARNAVPTFVRKLGLIITYKTDETTSVTEQFIGSAVSAWTTETNWKNVGSEGGNKILEWNTDAATTRKQVPSKERKAGMQISYKPDGEDWVNEQYIGTYFTDNEFVKDSNWTKIASKNDVVKVKDVTNGLSYNTCKSDIEAARLIRSENRKLNMNLTYNKYVEGKFSVLVIGTRSYSTGDSGNFYVTIDGVDYTIPYIAQNFAQFKDVRNTIIDYFSSHSLNGWSIELEGDGLRFTKDEGADETFSFSAGRPLIEEFELSFTDPEQQYTITDGDSNLQLYLTASSYGSAVNCSVTKNRSIKDIIDTITYSYKPNSIGTNNNFLGFIRTERLSGNSFKAIFDEKWNGKPVNYDISMAKDGKDSFDGRFPSELTVNRNKVSSFIRDKFGIYVDITYPKGEQERTIVYIGTNTADIEWFKIQNWYSINKTKNQEGLERKSLWNKTDKTLEIDISDGKPIFISLSQFASGNGIYEAEFLDANGNTIYSYSRNRYVKFANLSVLNALIPFLPKDTLVRKDGWSVLYGYNFGAAKVKITFNAGVPDSIYFNDLYILKEDDFNTVVGGIDEEFKINIATKDTATFAGGFNNMLDKIFEKNPWQKCVFITPIYRQGILHWAYPNSLPNTKCASEVVKRLAKYWNQPCIDLSNLGLFVHKNNNNLKTIMPDGLHTATSSPDVRIYVTLEDTAGQSGILNVTDNNFCNSAEISISEEDDADSILQKIHDNIVIKEHMIKSLDNETKSVLIHFDTTSYDANSYGNQKNNIPKITSTLDNVVITVKQPDNQCRVVAKFLSAQLTSIFGSLNKQRILWIGTSIPNGNTNGWATGEKYPELIQEITGCVMENVSYQGTCLRKYMPQFIGDDSEDKPVMTNSWNYNTSEGNSTFLSLEGILKKINTINSPDIIIFDHGINDEYDSKEWILYTWDNIYRED